MTLHEVVLCALLATGFSWFTALWITDKSGRRDLTGRVWLLYAAWFAVAGFCVIHAPDDRLYATAGWGVGVSVVLSYVVDELIERRW